MTGQKVKCKKATVVTKETKEQQQTGQVSMDIQEKIPKHRLERWPQRVCIQHSMLKTLPLNHGYGAHTLPTVRAVHTCHSTVCQCNCTEIIKFRQVHLRQVHFSALLFRILQLHLGLGIMSIIIFDIY